MIVMIVADNRHEQPTYHALSAYQSRTRFIRRDSRHITHSTTRDADIPRMCGVDGPPPRVSRATPRTTQTRHKRKHPRPDTEQLTHRKLLEARLQDVAPHAQIPKRRVQRSQYLHVDESCLGEQTGH